VDLGPKQTKNLASLQIKNNQQHHLKLHSMLQTAHFLTKTSKDGSSTKKATGKELGQN
jgi:hypothetical protein